MHDQAISSLLRWQKRIVSIGVYFRYLMLLNICFFSWL